MNRQVDQIIQNFGNVADDYERGRPGYAPEAVEFLVEQFSITRQTRILDVGAGTGKLTRQMLATGAEVVALEPVEGMRRLLIMNLPRVDIIGGSAESILLPDNSIDLIVCGQAFHWFRTEEALREFHRVLGPQGGLTILWNENDSMPWVRELKAILHRHEQSSRTVDASETWPEDFERLKLFAPLNKRRFPHAQQMDEDTLIAAVTSRSYIATLDDSTRKKVIEEVLDLVRNHPDIAGRRMFEIPHVTELFWSRAVIQDVLDGNASQAR